MLFVFYFLLLLFNSSLVVVQQYGNESLISSDKIDDFSEMTAYKGPSFFGHQVLVYLLFVAVYDHLCSTLNLVKIFSKNMSLMVVADYKRSTVDLVLLKGRKIVETSVVYIIFCQLLLYALKLEIVM